MKKILLLVIFIVAFAVLVFTGAVTADDYSNPINDDIESGNIVLTTKQIGKVEGYNVSMRYTGSPIKIFH